MAQAPAPGIKPPLVTAAAILLLVVGALNILGAITILGLGGIDAALGVVGLLIGAAAIFAGVQVLNLNEQGRVVGLAVGGIGALFNIYAITQGVTPQFIGLALNAFIIYALVTQQAAFRKV